MTDAFRPAGHRLDADELLAHAAWLRALARSLVSDEHAAEDVVQQTFATAVASPPRTDGALRGWLAKVARNAAWKRLRGERRRAAREHAGARREAEPSAAETLERIETQRVLLDAVRELDEPYRSVVVMRFYDGKTPREIARELGLSPEVVWQRLSRAMAMLRARLDRQYGRRDAWVVLLVSPLGGRPLATSTGAATALATGGAIVGTKTVLAVAGAAAVALWLVWPTGHGDVAKPKTSTAPETSPVAPKRPAARILPGVEEATVAARPRAKTRGRVVDAVSGEPLAGAKVRVIRKSPGGGFDWTLVTSPDGTFSGEIQETETYTAELPWSAVKSDIYVEASARGHIRFYEGPWTGPQGEDLGDVRLDRGVIVRGRVVTADGAPVPGAKLFASNDPSGSSYSTSLQNVRPLGEADASGRFELDEALHFASAGYSHALVAAAPQGIAWTILTVPKSRDVVDDVVLTVRSAAATVHVKDPEGRPVAGAVVTMDPQLGSIGIHNPGAAPVRVRYPELASILVRTTGDDGAARFELLPCGERDGRFAISASAPGFAVGWVHAFSFRVSSDGNVGITLTREVPLVGGGVVVDEHDRPVAGAMVTPAGGVPTPFATGADGAFVLWRGKGEAEGAFGSVEVTKEGFAKVTATIARSRDDGTPLPRIRLERPTPIEGRVVDGEGKPVEGATAWLWRADRSVRMPGEKTGPDGRISFPDATPGEWVLVVSPPYGTEHWRFPDAVVTTGGTRDVVVRLERIPPGRATVTVVLLDAETGDTPQAEAAMLIQAPGAPGRISPPLPKALLSPGWVTLEGVRPGEYALWIRVAGRPPQSIDVRVAESDTDVRATCRIRRAVTLSGRLVTSDQTAPLSKPRLHYVLAGGRSVPGGTLDWNVDASGSIQVAADGTFRVEGLPPGAYRLRLASRNWTGEAVADATQGDATADVEVRRGTFIRFRGSSPTADGWVHVETSLDDGPWTRLRTAGFAEKGEWTATDTLRPGRLRWRAVFRTTRMPFDVLDAAEPQQGEVVLEPGKDTEVVVPLILRR